MADAECLAGVPPGPRREILERATGSPGRPRTGDAAVSRLQQMPNGPPVSHTGSAGCTATPRWQTPQADGLGLMGWRQVQATRPEAQRGLLPIQVAQRRGT